VVYRISWHLIDGADVLELSSNFLAGSFEALKVIYARRPVLLHVPGVWSLNPTPPCMYDPNKVLTAVDARWVESLVMITA
jgi:hypothetical protein